MRKLFTNRYVSILILVLALLFTTNQLFSQTQRNPVIELCTGTWCQWCPCGHDVIKNTILANIPNAIVLEYHGAGSDPFINFYGNSIRSSLGLSSYPTGCIDRVSGVQSRGSWLGYMNTRNSLPATVSIAMTRGYNTNTRAFTASIDFTALQNLNGQFKFNAVLFENGIVWGQTSNNTCTPGVTYHPNYVHNFVVRDMMNGALGEEVINGAWAQSQVINKTVNYTVPVPPGAGPDIVPDSCHVVVFVYKVGSPLNANAEIQQGIQDVLISPDYVATITPTSPDVIADNTTPANFNVVIRNEGLLTDKYGINLAFDGPAGWTQEYTTVNGTFATGQVDSVDVASGDTTLVTVTVIPNGFDGFGSTELEFASGNNPSVGNSALLRNVTTTGINVLAVDADDADSETYISNSLDNIFSGTYGLVSRTALHPVNVDLSNFDVIAWASGTTVPAFFQGEVNALQTYLDNGGRLFISGQDIGSDIFEPTGQSQFAQSFYNNYLHADYLSSPFNMIWINGYVGDPITDGISFFVAVTPNISFDKIAPYDAYATPILKYLTGPSIAAIKTSTNNYRVVYMGIGFEHVPTSADRDTIMARSLRWFDDLTGIEPSNKIPLEFSLEQNYPNPFNPGTNIIYTLASQSEVSLKIYNNLGQEIRTLVNNLTQGINKYSVYWDGKDNSGNLITSGVYFYKLVSKNSSQIFEQSRKMLLIK